MQAYERSLEMFTRIFSEHSLKVISEDEPLRVYQLRDPKTGALGGCYVIETPCNMAITGDLSPGHNGVFSNTSYSVEWFSRPHGPQYLAEKFLTKSWQPELAAETLRDPGSGIAVWAKEVFDHEKYVKTMAALEALSVDIDCGDNASPDDIYRELSDLGIDDAWEFSVGWGYDPRDYGLLSAIHRRFVELMELREVA